MSLVRHALVLGLLVALGAARAADDGVAWKGELRSLTVASRTGFDEPYELQLFRLRVQASGAIAPSLALDLQYDNEWLLGRYLATRQFRLEKDAPSPQYWRAQANYLDRADVYARHRLYRAALTWSRGPVDIQLGRQRVAWGTGRLWSALDVVNPVNPIALERQERPGVDAALAELKLGPLSRVSLLYAPVHGGPAHRALQWHGHAGALDFSLLGGRLTGQDVLGADAATQLGGSGLRAELSRQKPPAARSFTRALVGIDHAFANTLTVSGELFYNGAGSADPAAYPPAAMSAAGAVAPLATRYAGLQASHELTPLLKWSAIVLVNLDDRSRALEWRLAWAAQPDFEATLGTQGFAGGPGSEFRRHARVWLVQLQWFR